MLVILLVVYHQTLINIVMDIQRHVSVMLYVISMVIAVMILMILDVPVNLLDHAKMLVTLNVVREKI